MCKCCQGGKSASKYKKFEFLKGHTHSHDHSHEHEHEHDHHDHHHHGESTDSKAMQTHVHGNKEEVHKE